MNLPVLTIGHSNHAIDAFMALLQKHEIGALVDVRSHPYSRFHPQYSRDALRATLDAAGVRYVFLGRELGARSENSACYRDGRVQYELLAKEPLFAQGLDRIERGAADFRLALMCAEKDPLDCHRAILVARNIVRHGLPVAHILADGGLESHEALEARMMRKWKIPEGDLLRSRDESLEDAYRLQGDRIAWTDEDMLDESSTVSDGKVAA